MRIIIVFIFVILSKIVFPQGPGGVSTNNEFWVKAESGITLAGTDVSVWADQSGKGNNASQSVSSYRPLFNSIQTNFNPSLYFNGSSNHLDINDLIAAGSNSVHIYAVGTNETGGDSWHCMVFGQTTSSWNAGYGITAHSGGSTTFGFWVNGWNTNTVFTSWSNQPSSVLEGKYDGTTVEFLMNSNSIGTDPYTGIVGDNGTTHLGGGPHVHYNHKGFISEVAIYSSALSATDQHKVNSYFGLKYSLTQDRLGISGDYLNSTGTSIYSDNGVDTYWNQIIGIGRQDDSDLIQKQSKSSDDSTKLYLSSLAVDNLTNGGSFSGDNQFIVVGHNNAELNSINSSEFPSGFGIFSRIDREWKITNTNYSGVFSLDLTLNTSPINPSDLRILIDTDGDFSSGAVIASPTITYSSGVVTISNLSTTEIPTNSTRYITIVSLNAGTPLPIKLLTFEPLIKDNVVEINWQTATEINNNYFTVERSQYGEAWQTVAKINGANNSIEKLSYSVTDHLPINGISYYRLKQTDFDGQFTYSKVKSVNINKWTDSEIKVYPNPAEETLFIEGINTEIEEINIYNYIGEKMNSKIHIEKKDNEITINISNLKSGLYIIQTKSSINKSEMNKFYKK